MLRFAGNIIAMLLSLSACTTMTSGPLLSPASVRRIADAEVRRDMKIDPGQCNVSAPHYLPKEDYWSVTYHLKANKRAVFTVRVSDKIQKASINESDAGVFEGPLLPKPDLH
jgi:hypothetical protein